VIGFDVDQTKVDTINAKKSFIKHIASSEIAEAIDFDRLPIFQRLGR